MENILLLLLTFIVVSAFVIVLFLGVGSTIGKIPIVKKTDWFFRRLLRQILAFFGVYHNSGWGVIIPNEQESYRSCKRRLNRSPKLATLSLFQFNGRQTNATTAPNPEHRVQFEQNHPNTKIYCEWGTISAFVRFRKGKKGPKDRSLSGKFSRDFFKQKCRENVEGTKFSLSRHK